MNAHGQSQFQGSFQGGMASQQQNTGLPRGHITSQNGMKQSGLQGSHGQYAFGGEQLVDRDLSLWSITKPPNASTWEDAEAEQLCVSKRNVEERMAKFRKKGEDVTEILISIKSSNARKAINDLVDDQNERLWEHNPTIQYYIASIQLDKEIVKHWPDKGKKRLKRIDVILQTEPRPPMDIPKSFFENQNSMQNMKPHGNFGQNGMQNQKGNQFPGQGGGPGQHGNMQSQGKGQGQGQFQGQGNPPAPGQPYNQNYGQPQGPHHGQGGGPGQHGNMQSQGKGQGQGPFHGQGNPPAPGQPYNQNYGQPQGPPHGQGQGNPYSMPPPPPPPSGPPPPPNGPPVAQGRGPPGGGVPPPPPPPPNGQPRQPQIVHPQPTQQGPHPGPPQGPHQSMPPPPPMPQQVRQMPGSYPGMNDQPHVEAVDPRLLDRQKAKRGFRYDRRDDSDSESNLSFSDRSVEGGFGLVERSRSRGRKHNAHRRSRSRSRSRSRPRSRSRGRDGVFKSYKEKKPHGRTREDIESPQRSPKTSNPALPSQNIFNIRIDNDNERANAKGRDVHNRSRDTRRASPSISPTSSPPIPYKIQDKYAAEPMFRGGSNHGSDSDSSFAESSSIYTASDRSVFSEPERMHQKTMPIPIIRSSHMPRPRDDGFAQSRFPDAYRSQRATSDRNPMYDDHIIQPNSPWQRPSQPHRRHSGQQNSFEPSMRYSSGYTPYTHDQVLPHYLTEREHGPFDMQDLSEAMELLHQQKKRKHSLGGRRGSVRLPVPHGGLGMAADTDEWANRGPPFERGYRGYRHV